MILLFPLLLFVLGCCIGSFINAAEYRLAIGEDIASGRSHCRNCTYTLAWYDLVPLLSFVVLSGKCRACKQTISWQYPVVEIVTGVLFAAAFFLRPTPIDAWSIAVLVRDLVVIASAVFLFVYDFKYSLLPDAVTLPCIVLFAVSSIAFGLSWQSVLIGTIVGGGFFLLQYLLSRGIVTGKQIGRASCRERV